MSAVIRRRSDGANKSARKVGESRRGSELSRTSWIRRSSSVSSWGSNGVSVVHLQTLINTDRCERVESGSIALGLRQWIQQYASMSVNCIQLNHSLPANIVMEFGNRGLFGMFIPTEHGGFGLHLPDILGVLEQLGSVDLTLAILVLDSVSSTQFLLASAPDHLKLKYLSQLAQGRIFCTTAITDVNSGSNPWAMETSAHLSADGYWELTGEKRFAGVAEWASLYTIFAQAYDEKSKYIGITAFSVPKNTAGLTVGQRHETLGLLGYPINDIRLEKARVSQNCVLGQPGDGQEIANQNMMLTRLLISAVSIGGIKRCVQRMIQYSAVRQTSFGKLIDNNVVRQRITELSAKAQGLECLNNHICSVLRSDGDSPMDLLLITKVFATETLNEAADRCIQVLGAIGYAETNGVAKYYRDARAFRIFEGPTETLLGFVGAEVINDRSDIWTFLSQMLCDNLVKSLERLSQTAFEATAGLKYEDAVSDYNLIGSIAGLYVLVASMRNLKVSRDQFSVPLEMACAVLLNEADLKAKELCFNHSSSIHLSWLRAEQMFVTLHSYSLSIGLISQWEPPLSMGKDRLLDKSEKLSVSTLDRKVSEAKSPSLKTFTVHKLFEERVKSYPNAPAFEDSNGVYTYADLNAKADRVADYLKTLYNSSEFLVGIYDQPGYNLVSSMLGVLKAGGAFISLDPDYPIERIEYILTDSNTQTVLTTEELKVKLFGTTADVISFEQIEEMSSSKPLVTRKVSWCSPGALCYVMYTSGTTGQPKGVEIEHKSVVNLCLVAKKHWKFGSKDKILLCASPNSDILIEQIFPTLSAGGTLVSSSKDRRQLMSDPIEIFRFCDTRGVTVLDIPTALWHSIAQTAAKNSLSLPTSLRQIIVGGERVISSFVRLWHQQYQTKVDLINTYGLTEVTVTQVYCKLLDGRQTESFTQQQILNVPIGKAIDNIDTFVLDDQMNFANPGSIGLLYLGGLGIGRGYLGKKDLTKEKFITNPLTNDSGEIVYATGDLVRQLPDGQLQFVGRRDEQVKVRGYRVILSEIEAALMKHPATLQAVVISQNSGGQVGNSLHAYVTVRQTNYPNDVEDHQKIIADLTEVAKKSLPDYMIPSTIQTVESFPLTPNGKIDKKSLPNPQKSPTLSDTVEVTVVEEKLLKMWAKIFGFAVERQTNFFEIGGHSLMIPLLIGEIWEQFGVQLSAAQIFSTPVLSDQAALLEENVDRNNDEFDEEFDFIPEIDEIDDVFEGIPRKMASAVSDDLTSGQVQTVLGCILHQNQPIYNEPIVLQIPNNLTIDVIKKSLNFMLSRHESLRTKITKTAELTFKPTIMPMAKLSVSKLHCDSKDSAMKLIKADSSKPLELLETLPLKVFQISIDGDDQSLLALIFHHIAIDGVSLYHIFLKEFSSVLTAVANRQEIPILPPIKHSQMDFARWQHIEYPNSDQYQSDVKYWSKRLANLTELNIPIDGKRPVEPQCDGDLVHFWVKEEVKVQLDQFCLQAKVANFVVLSSALKLLLRIYSQSDDVTIGTVMATRLPGYESTIGNFDNAVVLRTDFTDMTTFSHLVSTVNQECLEAYQHRFLPFPQIAQLCHLQRSVGQNPIFQVASISTPPLILPPNSPLNICSTPTHSGTAKFDLTFMFDTIADSIRCRVEFSRAIFNEATVAKMAEHFQQLLASALNNLKLPLAQLSCLSEAEKQRMLVTWNCQPDVFCPPKTLLDLINFYSNQPSDKIAVIQETEQLSYAQLYQKANLVKSFLLRKGLVREDKVVVVMPKSPHYIAVIIGVIAAGGCFIPVESSNPPAYVTQIIEDSKAKFVISSQPTDGEYIRIEEIFDKANRCGNDQKAIELSPNSLAYSIYTSGSTGVPKGVLIEHQSVVNTIADINRKFRLNQTDSVLSLSPMGFDLSIYDIFGILAVGGRLILPGNDDFQQKDPKIWLKLMLKHSVTIWNSTPITMALLINHADASQLQLPKSLRLVLLSGDWIPVSLPDKIRRLSAAPGSLELISLGGATEVSIWSVWHRIPKIIKCDTIPYGKPLANQQVFILDSQMNPLPLGVSGRLFIGGMGVARGYNNRAELTAKHFQPNPFVPGEQFYDTGDLAFFSPDGTVMLVGRTDSQVKLNGYRVDLSGLESVINSLSGVVGAIATVDRDKLVAQIQLLPNSTLSADKIRLEIAAKLPPQMIPSRIHIVVQLPLNQNGKLDRKEAKRQLHVNLVAEEQIKSSSPWLNGTEKRVAQLISGILGLETTMGPTERFFECGGNSVLAITLSAAVQKEFKKELPVANIYRPNGDSPRQIALELIEAN